MLQKILLFLLLVSVSLVSLAHHSVALNFTQELVAVEGIISSVKWVNPHSSFVLEVINEDGVKEEWEVEMLAKVALQRQGFDFDGLQDGEHIQMTGLLGREGRRLFFMEATLTDGRIVDWDSPFSRRFRKPVE